jgi:hypothetical protein
VGAGTTWRVRGCLGTNSRGIDWDSIKPVGPLLDAAAAAWAFVPLAPQRLIEAGFSGAVDVGQRLRCFADACHRRRSAVGSENANLAMNCLPTMAPPEDHPEDHWGLLVSTSADHLLSQCAGSSAPARSCNNRI